MFEIVSCQTVEAPAGKKHVVYSVVGRSGTDNPPLLLDRRYTDFLLLYRALRSDIPAAAGFSFPRKVLLGNFSNSVINSRRSSLSTFLNIISKNEKLRDSAPMRRFLVGAEEKEGRRLMQLKCYNLARPHVETVFTRLNMVYTERHAAVITALCTLTACCCADPQALPLAEKYTEMAIRRFECVSDVDLLKFYVPLLQLASDLWWRLGKDKQLLDNRLDRLKRQGHRVDGCLSLLQVILSQ